MGYVTLNSETWVVGTTLATYTFLSLRARALTATQAKRIDISPEATGRNGLFTLSMSTSYTWQHRGTKN